MGTGAAAEDCGFNGSTFLGPRPSFCRAMSCGAATLTRHCQWHDNLDVPAHMAWQPDAPRPTVWQGLNVSNGPKLSNNHKDVSINQLIQPLLAI